jgi:L-lactate dehydrogenase complex protein LldF
VRIDIPHLLVQQRAAAIDAHPHPTAQDVAMRAVAATMVSSKRFRAAERVVALGRFAGRSGRITALPWPGSLWTSARDAPAPPAESFRTWWKRTHA